MFACVVFVRTQSYTLSTGAKVDKANLPAPRQSGNGAAAEKWCAEEGKRLPTLDELKEMYENREKTEDLRTDLMPADGRIGRKE